MPSAKQIMKTGLCALLLALSVNLAASEAGEDPELGPAEKLGLWLARAAAAYESGDHAAWASALERLHRMRPHNPDFMYQLVTAYALTGQKTNAFNMMLRMQQQGLSYDWDENEDVASLRGHSLYDHLNTLMKEAGRPFGETEVAARLGARAAMPEALAFDPDSGRLFVGTVRDGRILTGDGTGTWEVFADRNRVEGLMAVFDLLVDRERGQLWVATGMTGQYRHYRDVDFGRTALIRLNLATGEKLGEYRVAADGRAHLLGSLTLAQDGTVYAADTLSPAVYRLAPGARVPEKFLSHPVFTSLRGIALSGDGELLYMSDYELGLFVAATDSGQAWVLSAPDTLNMAGIDGLYWWKGHLVAIQNGISPQRVMRLELGEDGRGVTTVAPLAAALPEFDTPTFGTLAGDELLFFAASHWDKVDGRGRTLKRPLPEVPILRTDIANARVRIVGREILEQLLRKEKEEEPEGG